MGDEQEGGLTVFTGKSEASLPLSARRLTLPDDMKCCANRGDLYLVHIPVRGDGIQERRRPLSDLFSCAF